MTVVAIYFIIFCMNSLEQQNRPTEIIQNSLREREEIVERKATNTDSDSSDDEGMQSGMLPEFVDVELEGESGPLRFHKLEERTLAQGGHGEICPFCAEKCSEPVCESGTTSLGCKFRAHLYCVLTLDVTTYKLRPYPKGLSAGNLEIGTISNQFQESIGTTSRAFLSLNISHPLTNLTFVALEKRMSILQKTPDQRFISWPLIKDSNTTQRGYQPNYVCLPFTDFRVQLEVDDSLTDKPKVHDFVVVFNPDLPLTKITTMFCKSGPVTIEMGVYLTDFKPILSLMNYKYKYTDIPLIVIRNIFYEMQPPQPQHSHPQPQPLPIQPPSPDLPQLNLASSPILSPRNPQTPQFYEYSKPKSVDQGYPMHPMYSFDNSHQFLNQPYQHFMVPPPDAYSVYSNEYIPQFSMSSDQYVSHPAYTAYDSNYKQSHPERSTAQTVNYKVEEGEGSPMGAEGGVLTHKQVRELVETKQLKVQAGTNIGSRQLQKYLRRCSTEEIEEVLTCIQDDLDEFVTNDYANYMLQSLVNACNVEQRTRIVVKLSKRMAELSKNKKGTYCLQALITKVLTPKQFKIIVSSVEKQFIELCQQLNSAHFLQRIISSFPVEQLHSFYVQLLQPKSFLRLSQNQTAVLVIKAFMHKAVAIEHMQRVFVMLIVNDLDTIIQDPFGNYVVQYAYEIYKQQVCRPITEKIVQKFAQYSVQKFSSCVVEKCANMYFNDIQAELLKSVYENNQALEEMLKFTVASAILQKLVKRNKSHPLVQNICRVLSLSRMSKYGAGWDNILYENREKAATCRNSHGGNFNSFTQAVQHRQKHKQPSKKGSKTPTTLKN